MDMAEDTDKVYIGKVLPSKIPVAFIFTKKIGFVPYRVLEDVAMTYAKRL